MCTVHNLDELRTAVESFVVANWPGCYPDALTITFPDGRPPFTLPHPMHPGRQRRAHLTQTCSSDGTTVNWYGRRFTFTGNQAKMIRMMWDEWENETPDVRQEFLLTQAGALSSRLQDAFKNHPAWGVVIVPGERAGTFRIADGQAEPAS